MENERRYKVTNVEHYSVEMKNTEKSAIKHAIFVGVCFFMTVVDTLFLVDYKDILPLLLLSSVGAGTCATSVLLNLKEMIVDIARLINFNKIELTNVTNNVTTSGNEAKSENVEKASPLNEDENLNSDTKSEEKAKSETNFQDERPKVSLKKDPLRKCVSLKKKR